MTDPIVDLLNRIRNGQAVLKPTVEIPFSNLKFAICQVLEREGFIEKIERKGRKLRKFIEITLKYEDKAPVISGLKRISKQGQRRYSRAKKIRSSRGSYGLVIISTSKGLLTDKEARKQKIGGEIIAELW